MGYVVNNSTIRCVFGEFVEISQLPSGVWFGSNEAVLLFDGCLIDV